MQGKPVREKRVSVAIPQASTRLETILEVVGIASNPTRHFPDEAMVFGTRQFPFLSQQSLIQEQKTSPKAHGQSLGLPPSSNAGDRIAIEAPAINAPARLMISAWGIRLADDA